MRKPFLSILELFAAALIAAVCCGAALWWFSSQGTLLNFGDATAHLNIARRLFDSITPDYEQIGTVWLPLPHWLMVPFAGNDEWWRTGLAGGIPAALCQALAAVFLFSALRRTFQSTAGAFTGMILFLANPNALYLGSTPMTEPFFALTLMSLFYFSTVPKAWAAASAGLAATLGALVRYEGWILIPFVFLYLAIRNWRHALLFGCVAVLGPAFWLGHNFYLYGDALEFYRGEWSAKMIYQRALNKGMARYPGDHDLAAAWFYFRSDAELVSGIGLLWLGIAGSIAALLKRWFWAIALLALPPAFYVMSMYSSGTPIFMPNLWPHSYYNTRYGLAALPLLAVCAASLTAAAPKKLRTICAIAVIAIAVAPWWNASPITWKEAEVNSEARRAWTREAAAYLKENYRGGGILTSFGDLTGIFQQAGIPLRETVHDGNGIYWLAQVYRPGLFLRQEWVVAIAGDPVATAVVKSQRKGPKYRCVKMVVIKGAPVIEIYRWGSQVRLPQEEPPPPTERTSFNDQ